MDGDAVLGVGAAAAGGRRVGGGLGPGAGRAATVTRLRAGVGRYRHQALGDDATGRVYSWYADDLTVSTIQPGF